MGREHPGVSVVMPAYNAEKTILRAMKSVLSQDCLLELLVVDDCSKDSTASIVEALAQKDGRVRLLRNAQNGGVSYSRRRAVEEASFEYIAFLDSDDYWEPGKLTRQLALLQENPEAPLCYTGSAFIDEQGRKSDYLLQVPERVTFRQLLKQNVISCSSVLVRRELIQAHPMVDDRGIHEDYASWLCMLRQIPYAVGINEPLLVYQVSLGSKSGNKLKAARMQWRTYRVAGVPLLTAVVSFCAYAVRNLKKYGSIKSGYKRGAAQ